ncbi:MAG: hypothetical protein FJ279_16295 [Planctomycetes bacterium]|nr:hypothetical protein [Planctomycetota bacterium]MBM4081258.1 hypothetical protein [Planctomycetota bacterium]
MPNRLAPELPESVREKMPPAYMTNEGAYWRVRDELLSRHRGKWVAFSQGQVVAFGDDFLAVMDEAGQKGHPNAYIDRVGAEGELRFRCRQVTFGYDRSHSRNPVVVGQVSIPARRTPVAR